MRNTSSTEKSLSAAQYILDQCREAGYGAITPQQIIKLTYIAHGLMLGKYACPLLDEPTQSWPRGPVVASVYHAVKRFRSATIPAVPGARSDFPFSEDETTVMRAVAKIYGKHSGVALASVTNRTGTPWARVRTMVGDNSTISNDILRDYYERLLNYHALFSEIETSHPSPVGW